jgi:hypothetical protein
MADGILKQPVEAIVDSMGRDGEALVRRYVALEARHAAGARAARACPVCDGTDAVAVLPEIIRLKNRALNLKSGRSMLRCGGCGCVHAPLLFQKEFYFEFVNQFYDVAQSSVSPDMAMKAGLRMNLLRTAAAMTATEVKSVLEVSSYDGTTLAAFQQTFNGQVKGIEPTVKAVTFAEGIFPQLKGHMHPESPELHRFDPEERFGAIIFSLSFQMICEPFEMLRTIGRHASPGAVVLMNEGGYINDVLNAAQDHYPVRFFFAQKKNLGSIYM